MKGKSPSKSWDDVFPDGHHRIHRIDGGCLFDLDVHEVIPKHWRSSSAAEVDSLPTSNIASNSFRNLKEDYKASKAHSKHHRLVMAEREVQELQKRLEHEQATNAVLKNALAKPSSVRPTEIQLKPAQELIREIATLEAEVANLEQHLLRLYRNVFIQSPNLYPYIATPQRINASVLDSPHIQTPTAGKTSTSEEPNDHRRSSSVNSPREGVPCNLTAAQLDESSLDRDWSWCKSYSQPISYPQEVKSQSWCLKEDAHMTFLSSREGTPRWDNCSKRVIDAGQSTPRLQDTAANTANRLSEDLVRCMAAVYCRLAEPSILHHAQKVSPSSSTSSTSTFTAQRFSSDGWASQYRTDISNDGSWDYINQDYPVPNNVGINNSTVEVHWISMDSDRLQYAAQMLGTFRSLVKRLEAVDPSQLTHEQKLAFWINIHNALMMHAYIAYGIPRNHIRRIALLQKAAYRIGGQSINVQTIQHVILKCRSHRPAKWIQSLLSPSGAKLKGDVRQTYALDNPEPLLCFALCCGGRSDPVVRIYREKTIYQDLDIAKRDFLHTNVKVYKDGKIILPRILEAFAKETSMKPAQLLEWVCKNVENKLVTPIKTNTLRSTSKVHRSIEWSHYDFTFRYLFVSAISNY